MALAENVQRYSRFSPAAMQRFMTGMLSTPLKVQHETTGALNVYSASVERFDERERDLAARFAAQASILLATVPPTPQPSARAISSGTLWTVEI